MSFRVTFYVICSFLTATAWSQVTISTQNLNFGSKPAYVKDSLSVTLTNTSANTISIGSLSSSDTAFSLRASQATIAASASAQVWVRISAVHNINYNEKVFISIPETRQTFTVNVTASVTYSESRYSSTQNKWDSALLSELTTAASAGHHALGYSGARTQMFSYVDDYQNNDNITCVYTGRIVVTSGIPSASGSQNMNTEHTWPQSKFGSSDPMVSDIHHLYPTDTDANGARSSYPFGNVVSATKTYNQSKLGTLSSGGTGFEPWNGHKGNLARSMFYFITRYPTNYGSFYSNAQDIVFRQWTKLDPVDANERTRNNRIEEKQGNRNPFIDHPEFVDRIYAFIGSGQRPTKAKISLSSLNLKFGAQTAGESYAWWVKVGNTGNANLTISNIGSNNQKFAVQNIPSSVSVAAVDSFKVVYTSADSQEIPTGTITLTSNAGTFSIKLNDTGNGDFNNNGSTTGQTGGGDGGGDPNPTGTTNPATNLTFSSIQTNSMTLAWTMPSGYSSSVNDFIVIAKEGSAPSNASGDISSVVANTNFGTASSLLGSDGKLVYKGDQTYFTLTGLLTGTTYYVKVYTVLNNTSYSTALQSNKQTAQAGGSGSQVAYGQNFEGWTTAASYADYTLAGTTGTGDWLITNGYRATGSSSSDGYVISGSYSVRLRNAANSAVTSPYISEGIGDIEFKYRQWDGNPALTFIVETSSDGNSWSTIDSIPGFTALDIQTYYRTIQNPNAHYFRVRNKGEERLMVDDIQISAYGAATPVEMSSFTVQSSNGGALIQWTTTSETNNSGFDVEKSDDGNDFEAIGFVQGAGTTTQTQNYQFTDANQSSAAWYRLKQIELNGDFHYTAAIFFAGTGTEVVDYPINDFTLLGNYPNPFNPGTMIQFKLHSQGQVKVVVYDMLGREIKQLINDVRPSGNNRAYFDARGLPSGIYFYTISAFGKTQSGNMLLMK